MKSQSMKAAILPDRGVVKISGTGAHNFLQGLVTSDVLEISPARPRFAALLTPQGKLIADFIIAESSQGGALHLDVPVSVAPALIQKLNLYKLRAPVVIEALSGFVVMALWNGSGTSAQGLSYPDPRLAALGTRTIIQADLAAAAATEIGAALVASDEYDAHRIVLGVPRGGIDFAYGDAFPHESDMDQLGGIDFSKGCYVGQEVVSRMEHRGTARNRIVPVRYEGEAPAAGSAIAVEGRPVGTMGSSADGHGLALLRLDRVADAMSRQEPLLAGTVRIRLFKPEWVRFAVPTEVAAAK